MRGGFMIVREESDGDIPAQMAAMAKMYDVLVVLWVGSADGTPFWKSKLNKMFYGTVPPNVYLNAPIQVAYIDDKTAIETCNALLKQAGCDD